MKKSTYQAIVVGSVALPIVGMVAEVAFALIPEPLEAFVAGLWWDTEMSVMDWVYLLALIALFMLGMASWYGLLRTRSWGPRFSLWMGAATWGFLCFAPPLAMSGLGYSTTTLGSALYGVALALPYCSPQVREMFWPARA